MKHEATVSSYKTHWLKPELFQPFIANVLTGFITKHNASRIRLLVINIV